MSLNLKTAPGLTVLAKFGAHKDALAWVRAKPTSYKLFQLPMALSVLRKCWVGIERYIAAVEGSAPTKPNRPIFESESKKLGVNFRQQEAIGVAILQVAELRLVHMRPPAKVRNAAPRTVVVLAHSVHALPSHGPQ
jgi:hypothetical protein